MFGKVFVVFQELIVVFADMGHRSLLSTCTWEFWMELKKIKLKAFVDYNK